MNEIMDFIMKEFGYLISVDKDGNTYTYDELIEKTDCSDNEKRLIRMTFTSNNIDIRSINKKIEQLEEKKTTLVKDLNYGEEKTLEVDTKPIKAEIEYEDDELIYEDYTNLEDFIKNEFIPNKVRMKVNRSRNAKTEIPDKPYPSIRLQDLTALRLNNKELEKAIKVIKEEGIRIAGVSQDLEEVSSDYDYIRTYKSMKFGKPLSKKELKEKLIEYYNNGDRLIKSELEDELIARNMRLLPYLAWRVAYRHDAEIEDAISSGFEGLLYAIRNYDPYMNASFSSYAVPCIKGYMIRNIGKEKNIPQYFYNIFQNVRYVVEKEWGQKFDGSPEMLDDIFSIIESQGVVSKGVLNTYYDAIVNHDSVDRIIEEEEGIYTTDCKSVEEMVFPSFVRDTVNEALDTLADRERQIITLRFGFDGNGVKTLDEVANIYGITRERVRQIECKALRKLRNPRRIESLIHFQYADYDEKRLERVKG